LDFTIIDMEMKVRKRIIQTPEDPVNNRRVNAITHRFRDLEGFI
jgi:hypothetical protein